MEIRDEDLRGGGARGHRPVVVVNELDHAAVLGEHDRFFAGLAAPDQAFSRAEAVDQWHVEPVGDRRAQLGCAGFAGAGDGDRRDPQPAGPLLGGEPGEHGGVAEQHGCLQGVEPRDDFRKRQGHRCRMEPERQPAPGRQRTGGSGGVHG